MGGPVAAGIVRDHHYRAGGRFGQGRAADLEFAHRARRDPCTFGKQQHPDAAV